MIGYYQIKKLALADAPASGGTITIMNTVTQSNPGAKGGGMRYKMLVFSIFSSHISDGTTGFTVDESWDGGANWDNLHTTAVIAATTYTKIYVKVSAPEIRVQYKNSANVLTTFRGGLFGDVKERSNG